MNTLNIIFTGDFAPCRRFEKIILKEKEQIFGDALPLIQKADISFVNLECPLTNHDKSIEKSGPPIKANPNCIESLKDFSIIGLANNHLMDYDKEGLEDTLKACESINVPTVGAGMNLKEAQQIRIVETKDLKIAIIAIAEHEFSIAQEFRAGAAPLDALDNTKQILKAKEMADLVFVTIHGGNEYFSYPRPGLRKICKYFIDMGVDGIFCHHPHVPGAYETYKEKLIVYSMGNLIFDNENPTKGWDEGYIVSLDYNLITKNLINFKFIPYKQSITKNGIHLLKEEEKKEFLLQLNEMNKILTNDEIYLKEWNSFVEERKFSILINLFFPFSRGMNRLNKYFNVFKYILPNKTIDKKLNMIRCESYYELLLDIMKRLKESNK